MSEQSSLSLKQQPTCSFCQYPIHKGRNWWEATAEKVTDWKGTPGNTPSGKTVSHRRINRCWYPKECGGPLNIFQWRKIYGGVDAQRYVVGQTMFKYSVSTSGGSSSHVNSHVGPKKGLSENFCMQKIPKVWRGTQIYINTFPSQRMERSCGNKMSRKALDERGDLRSAKTTLVVCGSVTQ